MTFPTPFTAVALAVVGTGPTMVAFTQTSTQWELSGRSEPPPLVLMDVLADVTSAGPGQSFLIGVRLTIAKGWHIYWASPGDSGSPTIVDVQAPHGWTIGPTQYPRPSRFITDHSVTWGYEDEVVLLVPVTAPPSPPESNELPESPDSTPATIDVLATWLVCKDICHIGDGEKTCTVEMVDVTTPPLRRFTTWQGLVPQPITDLPEVVVTVTEDLVTLTGAIDNADQMTFIPWVTAGVKIGTVASGSSGDRLEMTIPVTADEDNALGGDLRLRGLLALGDDPRDPSWAIDVELPRSGDTNP